MAKFRVEATRTLYMFTVIEADNLEEAGKIYDKELIHMDFTLDNSDWKLDSITEEEAN